MKSDYFLSGAVGKTNLSQKAIKQWNEEDIKQWFEENGILLELYELCQFTDGSELLSYAKILLEGELSHYVGYAEEFQERYPGKRLLLHQFTKFSNALRKLFDEHDQPTLKAKPMTTTAAAGLSMASPPAARSIVIPAAAARAPAASAACLIL